MTNRCRRNACMAVLGLALAGVHAADEPAQSAQAQARLAAVRAHIAELSNHLGQELKTRDAMSARLRDAELAVTGKRRRLEELHGAQALAERRRAELGVQQMRAQTALASARETLSQQLRAAYMIGRQEPLQLLLSQTNPAALGRTLTYYGFFAQRRSLQIDAIQGDVERLQQLAAALDQQNRALQQLAEETSRDMTALQGARAQRAAAVANLSTQLASGNEELTRLKREEQAEERLVADLSRVLQDFPTDPSQSFEQMRGKLPWPVPGKVSARYQASRGDSAGAVRWNGVMLAAPHGAKVRAPYFGRVVYADWLQGLGLLLIVAHSGGYMTLYGHAEVLYKSVGDWVAPGDVIAALSDTAADPQLYFEIRAGRKTVDPNAWLRKAP